MSGTEGRGDQRIDAHIAVRMRGEKGEFSASILDVSARGMLLAATTVPLRGEFVEFAIGGQPLVGQVRWSGKDRFGVRLSEKVDIARLKGARGTGIVSLASAAAQPAPKREAKEPQGFRLYDLIYFLAAMLAAAAFLSRIVR